MSQPLRSAASPPMSPGGFRSFVRPSHSVVATLFPDGFEGSPTAARVLERIASLVSYRGAPGRVSLDTLDRELRTPGTRPVANCLSLCCLQASCLRAAGFASTDVHVLLGGRRGFPHYHAWLLVRIDGRLHQVDPSDSRLRPSSGAHLLRELDVHAVFNDVSVHFLAADKRRVLVGAAPDTGLHLLLYGREGKDVGRASRDAGFRAVVAELLGGAPTAMAPASEAIDGAVRAGLLSPSGDGHAAGPRLLLVTASEEEELRAALGPAVDRYLGRLSAAVPLLRAAYERCTPSEQFPWSEVHHSVIAGMLMDLAVGSRLRSTGVLRQPDWTAVLWAFENIAAANAYGVQFVASPSRRALVAQLWHRTVRRDPLRLDRATLGHLVEPERRTQADRSWLLLGYSGWARRHGLGYVPSVPVFGRDDVAHLQTPLAEAANRLVDESVLPAFDGARAVASWRSRLDASRDRHVALRLLLEYVTDRAIDAGLLPPFPSGASIAPAWGRWVWCERTSGPELVAEAFAGPSEGTS